MKKHMTFLYLCLLIAPLSQTKATVNSTAMTSLPHEGRSLQTEYPPPCCYIENLYLDVANSTFFTLGENIDPEKLIAPKYKRGYKLSARAYDENGIGENKPIQFLPGTTLILMDCQHPAYMYHFYHLLEHVLGIWGLYGVDHFNDVNHILFAENGKANKKEWRGPNQINQQLLEALFPHATMETWADFTSKRQHAVICFERAFTSDRAICLNVPEVAKTHMMIAPVSHVVTEESMEQLAKTVQNYAGAKYDDEKKLKTITYLKRPPPRCFTPVLEERFLFELSQLPHSKLQVVDMASLSFKEQIRVASNTDFLISVHGNGLCHLLFLPKHAAILEIFPKNALTIHYRIFADMKGSAYLGYISNQGLVSKEFAYAAGPLGIGENNGIFELNGTIDEIDMEKIISIIKSQLKSIQPPFYLPM